MTIVADSGSILSFARANRLGLLRQVISDLMIPDAVYAVLLVDEREARREALHQGITVMGSLKVLSEAKARGIIPHVTPVLDELIAAGMYLSEPLSEAFLRQLGEAEDTQQP